MKIASTEQLREMDRQAIEKFHMPSLVLTENAALRVVEFLQERFSPLKNRRIAAVCGKGNNGGDGLAIARHLSTRFDSCVTVWLLEAPSACIGAAAEDYQRAHAFGLELLDAEKMDLSRADIVIDALFGTGIHGAVTGKAAVLIEKMNMSGKPIVAVDIPSGLNAETGVAEGAVVHAFATITLSLPKFGLLEFPGAAYAGELVIADICIPKVLTDDASLRAHLTGPRDVAGWLPARVNGRDANKGTFGHVVAFAGSSGFAGAPVLLADAAARGGAGLVTLAVPLNLLESVESRVSPVVMTQGLSQSSEGTFAKSAAEAALSLASKATAVALGPGLGRGQEVAAFVREFVARCPVPLVVDADALNLLALEQDQGAAIIKGRLASTILTPHPGEMGRLLNIETKAVQECRRKYVAQVAEKFGCVVLLKGARTLIADPTGTLYLNASGNPGMATGGAGDALSGLIAALLAQHLEPIHAAAAGAYVHGMAGELAASHFGGATGLIATDLIEKFPDAIAFCQKVVGCVKL